MIILDSFDIKNYKNLKRISVNNLKDINIFIGPNNSGKSSILQSIGNLSEVKFEPYSFDCSECTNAINNGLQSTFNSFAYPAVNNDSHLGLNLFEIKFNFNEKWINSFNDELIKNFDQVITKRIKELNRQGKLPDATRAQFNHLIKINKEFPYQLYIKQSRFGNGLGAHLSRFNLKSLTNSFTSNIVHINDSRLSSYKDVKIADYVKNSGLTATNFSILKDNLKSIVDPKIIEIRPGDGHVELNNNYFDSINNQGSGIRSLVCIMVDILKLKRGIIIIDEPELGLNPHAKIALLQFIKDLNEFQFFTT
jgi:predicted ATPase